jgi:hypothetical protein
MKLTLASALRRIATALLIFLISPIVVKDGTYTLRKPVNCFLFKTTPDIINLCLNGNVICILILTRLSTTSHSINQLFTTVNSSIKPSSYEEKFKLFFMHHCINRISKLQKAGVC